MIRARIHNMELVHQQLASHVKLMESYSEVPHLEQIIKSCRLKPKDFILDHKHWKMKLVLHRWWIDEFGNSLVLKKKTPSIIYYDLRLDWSKIITTDLYYGVELRKMIKMSTAVHLTLGNEQDLSHPCYLLTFLGIDRFLRSYLCWDGVWQQISPLYLGLKGLQQLFDHSSRQFLRLPMPLKKDWILPCAMEERCLGCLPAGDDLLAMLKEQYPDLWEILH